MAEASQRLRLQMMMRSNPLLACTSSAPGTCCIWLTTCVMSAYVGWSSQFLCKSCAPSALEFDKFERCLCLGSKQAVRVKNEICGHNCVTQVEGDGLLVKLDEHRAGRPPTSAAVAAQWFAQDLFEGAEDDDQEAEDDARVSHGKLKRGQPGAAAPVSAC